jgi:NAD(P)-dependent dehydrogenase (short-subunit alcohol dehydrogenase family)
LASAQSIVKTAMDAFGRLDILVNNAGVLRDKSFHKMEPEDFEFVVQVHLMGTVYCTMAAWPIMREAKYGRIVVTTSGSGTVGNFGQANDGAAKMAVNGLINCLCFEGAKYNILCNAISPSAKTRMTEGLIPDAVLDFMKPELVSPAVAWMASEQCNVSGEIFGADAGLLQAREIRRERGRAVRSDAGGHARECSPRRCRGSWICRTRCERGSGTAAARGAAAGGHRGRSSTCENRRPGAVLPAGL